MKTFKHGVHPKDGKHYAMDASIVTHGGVVGEYVFPLSQHIGAPAKPVVGVGDRILVGQMIAEAGGFVSAPIHSSVSGTVKALAPRPTVSGLNADCIVIESDGLTETVEGYGVERDTSAYGFAEICNAVQAAGIVGQGGAGFPTHVKIRVKHPESIQYLIVNGAECEPYLTCDYRLMLERGDRLIAGIELLLRLYPNAKCLIGIENNKPAAIDHLKKLAVGHDRIKVVELKTKYPQGGERMLVYALTGRKLNSSKLPADVGCVVINVATVISVYEALCLGMPPVRRVMTVSGDAVAKPCNIEVPTGMLFARVLELAGGCDKQAQKFIAGGPMMGTALFRLEIPVVKTSGSLLAFSHDPAAVPASPCIHCGKCVRACPENLMPMMLTKMSDHDDFESFEKYGGMECIECGSCAWVCPAKRHMVQSLRYGKQKTGAIIRARREAEGK